MSRRTGLRTVDHLSVVGALASDAVEVELARSARGGGSKRETSPGTWQLTVGVGVDDRGSVRRAYRTVHGNEKEATRAMAGFVTEVDANEGHLRASQLSAKQIDGAFDLMRRNLSRAACRVKSKPHEQRA